MGDGYGKAWQQYPATITAHSSPFTSILIAHTTPTPAQPRVVLADPGWVVIDKPAGMLSVPGKGAGKQDCAVARVRGLFSHADGPMVVHRLDMDTSGLMVIALTAHAQRHLSGQFEARTVTKQYVALVAGRVVCDAGEIDAPMRLDIDRRPYQIIDPVLGKPSRTHYRVLERADDRTRLALVPITGRSHQLRVHCAHLGHPILGDVLYGDAAAAPRLMLHACELGFDDPLTGQRVVARSEPGF